MKEMKEIYLYPISRRIKIPKRAHYMLCVYKIFYPPEMTVRLGKHKIVQLKDIDPWPPAEQTDLGLGIESTKSEHGRDLN